MDIIIFFIVLSVLIIVHEYGHFITAKKCGVKVERFALGFGPKLGSFTRDGTEFVLCLIPLGGYVKMAGDERSQCKGEPAEFLSQPVGRRAFIVFMGPVVNYLLAYVCFVLVFFLGYQTLSAQVGETIQDSPAQVAGLLQGDRIVAIDDTKILSWEDLQKKVSGSKNEVLKVKALRGGQIVEKTIAPRIEVLKNILGQEENVRIIGIKPQEDEIILLKFGLIESLGKAKERLWDITVLTYKAFYRMITGAMSPREAMTGPIGIFFIVKDALRQGLSYLLYIVGNISLSLAIFNLMPLPVLDGGHLALLAAEKLRGRALSPKVDEGIARVGFSLILCLALFVFYIDFQRYGWIDKIVGIWQRMGL